jgi:hypothetical protein
MNSSNMFSTNCMIFAGSKFTDFTTNGIPPMTDKVLETLPYILQPFIFTDWYMRLYGGSIDAHTMYILSNIQSAKDFAKDSGIHLVLMKNRSDYPSHPVPIVKTCGVSFCNNLFCDVHSKTIDYRVWYCSLECCP